MYSLERYVTLGLTMSSVGRTFFHSRPSALLTPQHHCSLFPPTYPTPTFLIKLPSTTGGLPDSLRISSHKVSQCKNKDAYKIPCFTEKMVKMQGAMPYEHLTSEDASNGMGGALIKHCLNLNPHQNWL